MVESIDTRSVCGHLKANLSGRLREDDIQKAIGTMVNMDPDRFEQTAKELAVVFTEAFLGNFHVLPEEVPHLAIRDITRSYVDRHGNTVDGNSYHWDWIDKILELPAGPQTYKIWAGMTNLKSACVIKTLSRSEKDAQRDVLIHVVDIDAGFLSEWRSFLHGFVPYLVSRLGISPDRQYDPIWSTVLVPTKHSVTLTDDGVLKSCIRGDEDYMRIQAQLRQPDINRLLREHTDAFISATVAGYDVVNVEMDIPTPFSKDIPIGKIGVSPKRAQKSRVVYEALSVLDSLSRPVFHILEQFERKWNLQGVMSHDDSRQLIHQKLIANQALEFPETFCSYDQTAFTDNFSYNLVQRVFLEELLRLNIISQFDLDVCDVLAHGKWNLKALGRKYEIAAFGTGTGMGTPPSFPLASICNGLLVALAYWRTYHKYPKAVGTDIPGLVVGDDCTCFSLKIGEEYEAICKTIGLVVNSTKSFKSTNTAEFCGKLITPDGIWDKKKLIDFQSHSGIVDQIRYYQESSELYFESFLDQFGPALIESVKRLAVIPQPYGAREFTYHEKEFSQLSLLDQVATLKSEVADLKHLTHREVSQEDYIQLARNLACMPKVRARKSFIPGPPAPSIPKLDPYRSALVHNALYEYNRAVRLSWEELIQAAQIVNNVYLALRDHDPDVFKRYQDDAPSLVPINGDARGPRHSDSIELASLVGTESPQTFEGGDDYDER